MALYQDDRVVDGVQFIIVEADITSLNVGAYVSPEYGDQGSFGGVNRDIARAGGFYGINRYDEMAQEALARGGKGLELGTVHVTNFSERSKERFIIHAVTVGSGPEFPRTQFGIVQKATENAVLTAAQLGVKDMAFSVMGTGIAGTLSPTQSMKAIASKVHQITGLSDTPLKRIFVAVYDTDPYVQRGIFEEVVEVVLKGGYRNVLPEVGSKGIDQDKFDEGKIKEALAIQEFRERQSGRSL